MRRSDPIGGSVGLARGQVARLSVHVAGMIGEIPPDPVDVALRIRTFTGDVLVERIVLGMQAHEGAFVDFAHPARAPSVPALAGAGIASRIQLIGEVEHTRGCAVGATLEVIAPDTGVTITDIHPCVIPAAATPPPRRRR